MSTQRDMSYKEFKAAAERNQFKPAMGGMWLEDQTAGGVGCMYGCMVDPDKGRIYYRASLARAIQNRAADLALGQKVIKLLAQNKTIEEIAEMTGKTKLQLYTARSRADKQQKAEASK